MLTATIVFIFALAVVASVLALIKYTNIIFTIVAAGSWLALLIFILNNPPDMLDTGTDMQSMVIYILSGISIGILFQGIIRSINNRNESRAEVEYYKKGYKENRKNYSAFMKSVPKVNPSVEGEDAYRGRVRAARSKYINNRRLY